MKKWLLISLAFAVLLLLAGGGWAAQTVRPHGGRPDDTDHHTRRGR